MTVGVRVTVGVFDGVRVKVGVFVFTGVNVGEGVYVMVAVSVGVFEAVFDGTTNPPPPGFGSAAGFTILAMRNDSLIPER